MFKFEEIHMHITHTYSHETVHMNPQYLSTNALFLDIPHKIFRFPHFNQKNLIKICHAMAAYKIAFDLIKFHPNNIAHKTVAGCEINSSRKYRNVHTYNINIFYQPLSGIKINQHTRHYTIILHPTNQNHT